jgi:hypothetical protein
MPGTIPNDNVLLALDQVIQAINDQALNVSQTCTPQVNVSCGTGGTGGTPIGDSVEDGELSEPETPPTNYDTYKCKAANFIVDYIEKSCQSLETLTDMVTDYSQSGLQLITALLSAPALLAALGLGTLVLAIPEAAIIAVVAAVAALIMTAGAWAIMLLMGRLADEIDNDRENLVCGLYNATSASEAKEFLDGWFNDAIDVITVDPVPGVGDWTQEKIDIFQGHLINIVDYFKINNLLNKLFPQSDEEKETDIENYTGTVDCSACGPCVIEWLFDTDTEGWTHSDLSDPGSSSAGTWEDGALKTTNILESAPNVTAWGVWWITGSWVGTAGDTFTANFSAVSDEGNSLARVKIDYDDETSEFVDLVHSEADTLVLTITQDKTIVSLSFSVARSTSGSGIGGTYSVSLFDFTASFQEVSNCS